MQGESRGRDGRWRHGRWRSRPRGARLLRRGPRSRRARCRPPGIADRVRRPPPKGQGQGGHPDLDVGRPVAPRHVRSQAGGGQRLLRPADKPIETNVNGHPICELLPLLAKQADKYSIIRSMTHGNNGHETAAYMVQTGRHAGRPVVIRRSARWSRCSRATTPATSGLIPPYIVLTQPAGPVLRGRFPGPQYKPFATGGDPAQARLPSRASSPRASPSSGRRTGASCSTSSTRSSRP